MATYYFRNTGDVNWGTATNWSLTDGGGATGAVPTAADDAYFTSNSGNCTVNASARVCKTLIFAGVGAGDYANTITMTNGITVSGNVTLSATMGDFLGAGNLTINATSTYDSNTKSFPNTLILTGTITVTLAENATVGGLTSQTNTVTLNSNTLNVSGNLTTNSILNGTTTVNLTGTGTWTYSSSGYITNNLNINTFGTITLTSPRYSTGTITYISGTLSKPGTFIFWACTIKSNGVNWGHVQFGQSTQGGGTVTLLDNFECDNFNNNINSPSSFTFNGFELKVNGNFTNNTSVIGGTTLIKLIGTGTLNATVRIENNFEIDSPSGTITFGTTILFANSSTKYIRGTINKTSSNIRFHSANITSNGLNWGNVYFDSFGYTINFVDNFTCDNFSNIAGNFGIITLNSNNVFINGNILITQYYSPMGGTATINIVGSGNQTISIPNNYLQCNTIINKSSGTLTFTGNILYGGLSGGSTLTHTAGTINPSTFTFTSAAGTTYNINSSGFTLYNWTANAGTHTIQGSNGLITVNNNMTFNGNTTFAGTGGWTVANISDTTAGRTLTLKDGSTYTITTAMTLTGTNASPFVVASSSATLRSILTLNYGASQTVQFVTATRIDSSAGQTIWDTLGTGAVLTNTLNWNNGARPAPFNTLRMA